MSGNKTDLINYRILRTKEAYKDAQILAERSRWNSIINRLTLQKILI